MLVGVGLGPGNPELMTLKAVKTLKESYKVFAAGTLAASIVEPYVKCEVLHFPMTKDEDSLNESWVKNAEIIVKDAKDRLVSFACLGDPNFFSTFNKVRAIIEIKYPEIEISTVPGVSSITAFASKANVMINESFEVIDGSPILSKIVLKVREPKKLAEVLEREGYCGFILVERIGMEGERVIMNKMPPKSNYLSILYATKSGVKDMVGLINGEKF